MIISVSGSRNTNSRPGLRSEERIDDGVELHTCTTQQKQLNASAQCRLYTGRNHGSSNLITNTSLQMLLNYHFHWADGCQLGSRLWTRSQPISHSDTRLWSPSRGKVHKNLQAFNCGINAVTRFQRNPRCNRSHDTRPDLPIMLSDLCCITRFLTGCLAAVMRIDWQEHHLNSKEQVLWRSVTWYLWFRFWKIHYRSLFCS